MAHETLRFNVLLKENTNYGTNRQLNSLDPIYSDAHYGTQYGVFANFVGKKVNDTFEVKMVELELQNYTGAVTIGLVKSLGFVIDEADSANQIANFSSGRLIKLYVVIQALNNSSNISIPEITSNEEFSLENTETQFTFVHGDILEVVPIVMPINSVYMNTEQSEVDMGSDALFADTEYSYRNGETIEITRNNYDRMKMVRRIIKDGLPSEKY